MLIRDAHEGDIEGILAIYNDAVANTTAIWNEVTVDAANRAQWLAERQRQGYPVLVAIAAENGAGSEAAGQVLGYASFGDWRAFDGYRHTVEHSVYVRQGHRGAGIGKALMRRLIERARGLGKHVMVAGVEAGNEASLRLHQDLGFEQTGTLKEVGQKFGQWLDLTFLTLRLDAR
ncbi:N-acetyltransferase family protein [Humidesulfovibrio idahonensis]